MTARFKGPRKRVDNHGIDFEVDASYPTLLTLNDGDNLVSLTVSEAIALRDFINEVLPDDPKAPQAG